MIEVSKTDKTKTMLHIIIDWSDVWNYIHQRALAYPVLYDEGWKRIGCIGCPMAGTKEVRRQFERYPNYRKAYINTIQRCLERKPDPNFKDAEEKLEWWLSRKSVATFLEQKKQMDIFSKGDKT